MDLLVAARNQASPTFKEITGDLNQLNNAAAMVSGGLMGMAAGMGIDALVNMGKAVYDLGQQAQGFIALKSSFEDMAASIGASGDTLLGSLRGVSAGMIADQDLVLAANRAIILGVTDSSEKMQQLMQIAITRGRAMGLSATQAFNDLVTGLGRMSPLILDNLGIVTGGEKVFKDYADGIGKTAETLSDAERKQALFNKVLAESKDLMAGGVTGNPFAKLEAQSANLRLQFGQLVAPLAGDIADAVGSGLGNLSGVIQEALNQDDLSTAGKFGYALGVGIKEAIIAGLGQGGPIEFRTLFSDDFMRSASEAGLATRKALIEGLPEIYQAAGRALGDSSALTDQTEQMTRLRDLESQIITNFNAVMTDTQTLTRLMETGNNDLMTPVFDVRAGHLEELKRVRAEYAALMEGMRNVPGPVMAVSDSLWDGITGWRDMTRAAKDAVSVNSTASAALGSTAGAIDDAAKAGFNFAASLDFITANSDATTNAVNAAGNAINTIRGLMVDAVQAGANQGDALAILGGSDKIKQDAENLARTLSSLGIDDQTIAFHIELNTAEAVAHAREFAAEAQKAKTETAGLTTEADRAKAALILAGYATAGFASGLSQIQAQAGATAGIIYNLTGAINQLNAVTGVMQSNSKLFDSVNGQLNGITSGLMNNMGVDGALAKGAELKVQYRQQIESLREQGYTTAEIQMILQSNVQETQQWASGLDRVAGATGGVGAATQQVNQQYEDLKSQVQGILGNALNVDVGVNPEDFLPREDAVNEDARRLADVMVKGFESPWYSFLNEKFPGMFDAAAGGDIKEKAANIMRDFQDGLAPGLIDKETVKERVRRMILGEQSMAALASEIAQEMASELGVSFAEAQQSVGAIMGVQSGNLAGAGAGISEGFAAATGGDKMVGDLVVRMEAAYVKLQQSGSKAGEMWGTGFMSVVETSVSVPLIHLLAVLVTPAVLAQLQANQTQTTPP